MRTSAIVRSSAADMNVLRRETWHGEPDRMGEMYPLTKGGHRSVIELWSHWAGWELKLVIAGELQRSQVCRSEDDVFTTAGQWADAMKQKGWT